MRLSLDLRISLSESETTAIAVAAFYAKLPMNDWVKQQLLAQAGLPAEKPAIPALPPQATAPAPVAEPESPPPPEPSAPAAPAAPAAEEPLADAAASDASPVAETKKKRKRIRSADKPGVPRGFYAIMEKAEKIHAGRMQIVAESGATGGRDYVMKMSKWYKEAGFGNLDITTRSQLLVIGRNAVSIRAWHAQRPGSIPNDIVPSILYNRWERDGGIPVESEAPSRRRQADAIVTEPPSRREITGHGNGAAADSEV